MIPPETILETSATMIIGILFVVTIAKALEAQGLSGWLFWFCVWALVPFSVSAVLALLELAEPAKWACIAGFISFAFWLTLIAFLGVTEEE